MKHVGTIASLMVIGSALLWTAGPANATQIAKSLANRTFACKGGNESAGHDYQFRVGANNVERIDYRFPEANVQFLVGNARKGSLDTHWSFETLSEVNGSRLMLYERVTLRSPSQTKHIYRTYELFDRGGQKFMTLYDGVNGARDWKIKTTRPCGYQDGTKMARRLNNRYWSTTFSN